jgi:D-alanyl-D-alanine carboxypeptidase
MRIGRAGELSMRCGWTWTVVAWLFFACRGGATPIGMDRIFPVSETLCVDMVAHHVMNSAAPVSCERLRVLKFSYIGFDQLLHNDGEMVVLDAVSEYALKVFAELRKKRFPLAKAQLMNAYDGDDNASMSDNNTSAFNDRRITGGDLISLHAYGVAIDLNPVQNPYLKASGAMVTISPKDGADYLNRLNDRPGKMPRAGMAESVVDIFAKNGFLIWGGYWDNPIDYQHFEVGRDLAEKLVHSAPAVARELFAHHVTRYLTCRRSKQNFAGRSACISAESLMSGSSAD